MKNYFLSALLILSILLQSCLNEDDAESNNDDTGIESAVISSDFSYETTQEVTVQLTVPDFLKNAVVSICTYQTGKDSAEFARATFNDSGYLESTYTMPSYIDSLVVVSNYLGLTKNVYLPIVGSTASYDYTSLYETSTTSSSYTTSAALKSASADGFSYLADSWTTGSEGGVPSNLMDENDGLSSDFLDDVNASLPEQEKLYESHPEYLEAGKATNIELIEDADVWITFVTEGAGWKNALGFYTYEVGNEPQTEDDIENLTIIFPNASQSGSGGGLVSGNKVHLGTFSAGTGIGWFLACYAWNGTDVSTGNPIRYSDAEFNEESDADLQQHMVMLYDDERELFLLGFEDVKRSANSCDHDFNDAVFYATANPITAVSTDNVNELDTSADKDGDGVDDESDDYPDDSDKAFDNYSPSVASNGVLAFEDLWPSTGDYDFNDCVFSYNFNLIANADNEITTIDAWFVLTNDGAGYDNGFGFIIDDIAPSAIASIEGQELTANYVATSSNGTESDVDETVIFVADQVSAFLNDTISITITLSEPLSTSELGSVPFNPFLIIDGERAREVHLPDRAPSSKGTSYLGTLDDTSNASEDRYFKTSNNLPWGLNIYESFEPSAEGVSIDEMYSRFISWATSGGTEDEDWYKN